tara:strand:- start:1550 stop:2110 length:561 start_codon:yes stop_codon:yes gene_type:complete
LELRVIEKKKLRKHFLKIRSCIQNKEEKEKKICKFLGSLNFEKKTIISGYYPVRGEANILPFLELLIRKKNIVCLPCIEKIESFLVFKKWDLDTEMKIGKFNINEPDNNLFEEPSRILVPLLAFDKNNYRLGYGGGFYDRTIAYLEKRKKITTIGIGFYDQKIDVLPRMSSDKKLDFIITENGVQK